MSSQAGDERTFRSRFPARRETGPIGGTEPLCPSDIHRRARRSMTNHTHDYATVEFLKLLGKSCERMKMEKGSSCARTKTFKKKIKKNRNQCNKRVRHQRHQKVEALESDSNAQNRHKQSCPCEPFNNLRNPKFSATLHFVRCPVDSLRSAENIPPSK